MIKNIFISILLILSTSQILCRSAEAAPLGRETISILYFDNIAKDKEFDWLSKGIADMLISEIAKSGSVDVVERSELKKILDEQNLSQSDLVDSKKTLSVGKLLSATKLIYGSYAIHGKSVSISGKITETESGKIISAFSVDGPVESIIALQNELSLKAKKGLGMSDSLVQQPSLEYSFEAVKKYYQGIDLLDKGAVEDAQNKFNEAVKIDPNYIKPYQGIEESYKFLKNFTKMRQQREINVLYDRINKIQIRLKEKPWRTFADIAMDPRYNEMRKNNNALYEKEFYAYYQGDTPPVCTWNLQNNLMELADLYEEYFQDTSRAVELYKETISITERSRKLFQKDPFFPEVLYAAVLSCNNLGRYDDLKQRCEELMNNYADYRMMWAVEDFYKKSLEELSKKEK